MEAPLTRDLVELKAELNLLENSVSNEHLERLNKFNDLVQTIASKSAAVESERQMYKDMAQSLKGDVKVVCRVRPDPSEDDFKHVRAISARQLEVWAAKPRLMKRRNSLTAKSNRSLGSNNTMERSPSEDTQPRMFFFDRVLHAENNDDDVFECLQEDVVSAIHGHQVCIFAYGATGAGKTHTIDQLTQRAIRRIECECRTAEDNRETLRVRVQMVEVYNETFRDLLAPETPSSSMKVIASPHDAQCVILQNGAVLLLSDGNVGEELLDALDVARANRATAVTNIHERSSRSHLIITIFFTRMTATGAVLNSGKLSLVDLAGSERLKNTDTGPRMKEGQHINKSLSALGDVLWAHERKVQHIPYRNSRLTHLLQDSLGGQMSRTVMILAVSPLLDTMPETLASIQFGSRLNNLAFTRANQDRLVNSMEHSRLRSMVEQRSLDQGRLEEEIWTLKGQLETLRSQQEQDQDERDKLQDGRRALAEKLKRKDDELGKALCRIESLEKQVAQQKRVILERDDMLDKRRSGGGCGRGQDISGQSSFVRKDTATQPAQANAPEEQNAFLWAAMHQHSPLNQQVPAQQSPFNTPREIIEPRSAVTSNYQPPASPFPNDAYPTVAAPSVAARANVCKPEDQNTFLWSSVRQQSPIRHQSPLAVMRETVQAVTGRQSPLAGYRAASPRTVRTPIHPNCTPLRVPHVSAPDRNAAMTSTFPPYAAAYTPRSPIIPTPERTRTVVNSGRTPYGSILSGPALPSPGSPVAVPSERTRTTHGSHEAGILATTIPRGYDRGSPKMGFGVPGIVPVSPMGFIAAKSSGAPSPYARVCTDAPSSSSISSSKHRMDKDTAAGLCSTATPSRNTPSPKSKSTFYVDPISVQDARRQIGYTQGSRAQGAPQAAAPGESPLLFIHRVVLPEAEVEDTCSHISLSSNGSDIKTRLRDTLITSPKWPQWGLNAPPALSFTPLPPMTWR